MYLKGSYLAIGKLQNVLKYAGFSFGGTVFSGKTGTTKNGNIFAGYNDEVSLAIWLGFKKSPKENDPKAIMSKHVLEKVVQRMLGYKSNLFSI